MLKTFSNFFAQNRCKTLHYLIKFNYHKIFHQKQNNGGVLHELFYYNNERNETRKCKFL